ncbi:MAG: hypothetical protein JF886_03565 [Candidatus Dormibacteraeota bacterium]|uniref:Uncharacterized protein n=1 Tax=Candidatus Aeolococcus gillhamiae TaxID=3127015 RepID=A0A934N2R5_9BACT|nr:hypothetical protein [Candidatus Dormibacteraeota bacterium]
MRPRTAATARAVNPSSNVDLWAVLTTAVLSLALLLVPFIPACTTSRARSRSTG